MKKVFLLLLGGMSLLTSCATIIRPEGEKNIPVTVKGADEYSVFVNGINMGEADYITVHKGDIVTIEADGYRKSVTNVQGKFNGWVIGNLVFGGLIGVIVDGVTGNFNRVTTHAISAKLKPEK